MGLFRVIAVLVPFSALMAGCFEHRDAPERLVSAKGMEEAEKTGLAEVESLDLSGFGGEALPGELASMPRLRVLYLRGGTVGGFQALAQLKSLEVLDLGRVALASMPEEVLALQSLRDLYLSECGLDGFPGGLETLPRLRYLNLDGNRIGALPGSLPAGLRWLRLNRNSIASLPDSVGTLAGLQRLYLRGNSLTGLPDALAGCAELEDLDLASNDLDGFPAVLASLPKLRNLDLSGNRRITALPDDATLAKMSALRTLRLTGCPLDDAGRARVRAALPKDCAIIF